MYWKKRAAAARTGARDENMLKSVMNECAEATPTLHRFLATGNGPADRVYEVRCSSLHPPDSFTASTVLSLRSCIMLYNNKNFLSLSLSLWQTDDDFHFAQHDEIM